MAAADGKDNKFGPQLGGALRGQAMFLRILDRLEEILITSLMAAATLLIFVAVIQRYAVGIPFLYPFAIGIDLTWAQELCILMFVWMAKFGAAYGVRTGVHVGVDVALTQLNKESANRIILFGLLCGAFFTGTIAAFGARFVWKLAGTDQVSPDLEWPMAYIYLAIPCGSALMCFRFLQVAWAFYRTGNLPHHDAAKIEGVAIPDIVPGAPEATAAPAARATR
jgi:C4-dicarboxylate transporter, DctQ subunit